MRLQQSCMKPAAVAFYFPRTVFWHYVYDNVWHQLHLNKAFRYYFPHTSLKILTQTVSM